VASWSRAYGGTDSDDAFAIAPTPDGGYVVAGSTESFGAGKGQDSPDLGGPNLPGKTDVWVLKLDGRGNVQWQKTYGGPGGEEARAIAPTSDGGYVVAAWVGQVHGFVHIYEKSFIPTEEHEYTIPPSFGAGKGDVWVLKLDGSGNVVWQKTYGGTNEDEAHAIVPTSDGGYIVAGSTESFGAGKGDVWVLKLDGSGNVQWQKTYGGTNWDGAHAIAPTSDGGYVVAGRTESFGAGGWDVWVLKLDGSGNVVWQKTYGGTNEDEAHAIVPTSDGGYVVAGKTWSFGAGHGDVWVLKLDGSGNVVWQKTYGGTNEDEARAIVPTSDGGYIVAGSTFRRTSSHTGNFDVWVLKLDGSGNVQWQKTYGGTGDEGASAIAPTSDGGYVVAGRTSSFTGNFDVWVLKLEADGTVRGCPSGLVRDSAASVGSTSVSPGSTSVAGQATSASVALSSAVVGTSSASPTGVCTGLSRPRKGRKAPYKHLYLFSVWGL
jgi:uncharacterized delta-60 repeat protein